MRVSPASLKPALRQLAVMTAWAVAAGQAGHAASDPVRAYFGIQIVDAATGRGVPLAELETVNHLRFVTDSAGWVAFHEPGLMGRPVFFHLRSHGYTLAKDGFGYSGRALTPTAGGRATLQLTRQNIAERLYRVTGEGIYRDSVLLGEPVPLAEPLGAGRVAGQDSVLGTLYRGRLYWFWGDTLGMKYPLGHFRTAGATSDLPNAGGLDPASGINLHYWVDADGFSRPVASLGVTNGLIWLDGVLAVKDEAGKERLVAHYAHLESLGKPLDHGLAVFNDERQEFERWLALPADETWRFPHGQPVRFEEDGVEYLGFGDSFLNVRVPANWRAIADPARYEAWSRRAANPPPPPTWTRDGPPLDPAGERKLLDRALAIPGEAWFLPVAAGGTNAIVMHRGSVRWNAWRQRWVLIATQEGGTSLLGEVWYAEARVPTGPWRHACKIVTHDRYTFYNPVHHAFFDQADGRFLFFEGTYANTFSGNPDATPRYDYNQVMYRLDLGDARLQPVHE